MCLLTPPPHARVLWRQASAPRGPWRPLTADEMPLLISGPGHGPGTDAEAGCLFQIPGHLRAAWWDLLDRSVEAGDAALPGFEDFTRQVRQIRAMGPLDQVLGMIPGLGPRMRGMSVDERALGRIEAMINSMTPDERQRPQVIDGSRRRRIARGSGTSIPEVNRFLRQFEDVKKMLRQMESQGRRRGKLPMPFPPR